MMIVEVLVNFDDSLQIPNRVKIDSFLFVSSAEVSHDCVAFAHVDMVRGVFKCWYHLQWVDGLIVFCFML
jgi:hypothetical protein